MANLSDIGIEGCGAGILAPWQLPNQSDEHYKAMCECIRMGDLAGKRRMREEAYIAIYGRPKLADIRRYSQDTDAEYLQRQLAYADAVIQSDYESYHLLTTESYNKEQTHHRYETAMTAVRDIK